jgi:hypothetical protein
VCNPPWRIVPPHIAYPNPTARVGRGPDGLDRVRMVLKSLPRLLAPGGSTILRFDAPTGSPGAKTIIDELGILTGTGFAFEKLLLSTLSVYDQAAISADTCSHLNAYRQDLAKYFIDHYNELGIISIEQLRYIIRREDDI